MIMAVSIKSSRSDIGSFRFATDSSWLTWDRQLARFTEAKFVGALRNAMSTILITRRRHSCRRAGKLARRQGLGILALRHRARADAAGARRAAQEGRGSQRPMDGADEYRQKRYLTFIVILDILRLSSIPISVQT